MPVARRPAYDPTANAENQASRRTDCSRREQREFERDLDTDSATTPAPQHRPGRRAQRAMSTSRSRVTADVGASPTSSRSHRDEHDTITPANAIDMILLFDMNALIGIDRTSSASPPTTAATGLVNLSGTSGSAGLSRVRTSLHNPQGEPTGPTTASPRNRLDTSRLPCGRSTLMPGAGFLVTRPEVGMRVTS